MAPAWFSSSSGVSTCSATWQVSVSLYSSGKSFSPAQTWQKGSSSSRSLTFRTRFFMHGVLLWICIVRSLNGSNHVVGTNASTVNGKVGEITCWQLACLPWTFVGLPWKGRQSGVVDLPQTCHKIQGWQALGGFLNRRIFSDPFWKKRYRTHRTLLTFDTFALQVWQEAWDGGTSIGLSAL